MKKHLVIPFCFLATMMGCASVKDSTEYKQLAAEVRANEVEASSLEAEIKDLATESLLLETELKASTEQRQSLRESIGLALNDPAKRIRIGNEILPQTCKNRGFVGFLTDGKVDRSDDAWLTTAESVGKYLGKPYTDLPTPVDDDKTNISESAQAGFKAFEQEFETKCDDFGIEGYRNAIDENCKPFNPLVLKKDPELHEGKCWVGRVEIAQFDSATGKCAFHGYIDGDFNVRATFGVELDPNTHSTVTECSWTKDIVEDMWIKFWGWGLGTFTYETANGSTATVPSFRMVQWQEQ